MDMPALHKPDSVAEEHMHQSPEEDVDKKEYVYVDILDQEDVEQEEHQRYADNGVSCLSYGHADGEKFMVDMAAVRSERITVSCDTVTEEPDDIENRHQKNRQKDL